MKISPFDMPIINGRFSPEPSLWDIVEKYYIDGGFSSEEAAKLTDEYFIKLQKLSED